MEDWMVLVCSQVLRKSQAHPYTLAITTLQVDVGNLRRERVRIANYVIRSRAAALLAVHRNPEAQAHTRCCREIDCTLNSPQRFGLIHLRRWDLRSNCLK